MSSIISMVYSPPAPECSHQDWWSPLPPAEILEALQGEWQRLHNYSAVLRTAEPYLYSCRSKPPVSILRDEARRNLQRMFNYIPTVSQANDVDPESAQDEWALDYGCGDGFIAGSLALDGYNVAAFDPQQEMYKCTTDLLGKIPGGHPTFLSQSQITRNKFWYVFCGLVLCILDESKVDAALQTIHGCMKPGGRLDVLICNPDIAHVEHTALDIRFPQGLDLSQPARLPKLKKHGHPKGPYGVHEFHRPESPDNPWWSQKLRKHGLSPVAVFNTPSYSFCGDATMSKWQRVRHLLRPVTIPGDYKCLVCIKT